jgi:hypothetical protein
MSVIFKEKKFDQLLLFFNKLFIIFLALLVLLTVFNYFSSEGVDELNNKLKLLQKEELKYKSLITNAGANKNLKAAEHNKYNLLISLADYADQIIYSSLHYKKNRLQLKAVSSQQDKIFTLIDVLENDQKFKEVDLVSLGQKGNYFFELEILIAE